MPIEVRSVKLAISLREIGRRVGQVRVVHGRSQPFRKQASRLSVCLPARNERFADEA